MSINCNSFSNICKYCDVEKLKKMLLLSKEVYDLVKEVNYKRGETFIQKCINNLDEPKFIKKFEKGPKNTYNIFTDFFFIVEVGKIITSSKNLQEICQEFPFLIKFLDRILCVLNKCINYNITSSEFLFDVTKRIDLQKKVGFNINEIQTQCADEFYNIVGNLHFDRAKEYFTTCNDYINLTYCFMLMCEKRLIEAAIWVFNFSHSLPSENKKKRNYNFHLYEYCECSINDLKIGIGYSRDHGPIHVCAHHNYVFVKNINDIDMLKFLWRLSQQHNQTINIHKDNDRLYGLAINNAEVDMSILEEK